MHGVHSRKIYFVLAMPLKHGEAKQNTWSIPQKTLLFLARYQSYEKRKQCFVQRFNFVKTRFLCR